jgi:hypothetical protein
MLELDYFDKDSFGGEQTSMTVYSPQGLLMGDLMDASSKVSWQMWETGLQRDQHVEVAFAFQLPAGAEKGPLRVWDMVLAESG